MLFLPRNVPVQVERPGEAIARDLPACGDAVRSAPEVFRAPLDEQLVVVRPDLERRVLPADEGIQGVRLARPADSEHDLPAAGRRRTLRGGSGSDEASSHAEDCGEALGSERLTGATLDRLTRRCQIIEIKGESHRLRDAQAKLRKGCAGDSGSREPRRRTLEEGKTST